MAMGQPVDDRDLALGILGQCGAAFDPVAVVVIGDLADFTDLGAMDMAADHPGKAALARNPGDCFLELADIEDGVLDLALEVGRQRPVGQPQRPPRPVEHGVDLQQQFVGLVAQQGQPAGMDHHSVEGIAVDHQQAAAIGGDVHRLVDQFDPAESQPGIVAQHLVVVAGNEHHPGAAMRHLEDAAQHLVVGIGPEPALFQPPAVDDVAHQIERLALDRAQEIGQQFGIAARGAEVDV